MKKLTYLLTLMFAIVLMSTSCEEDEPAKADVVDDGLMTLNELSGTWNIESFYFDDVLWTSDNVSSNENDPGYYIYNSGVVFKDLMFDVNNLTVSFDNVIYVFTKEGDVIYVKSNGDIIAVLEITGYTENELKLEWSPSDYTWNRYWEGGISTFTR